MTAFNQGITSIVDEVINEYGKAMGKLIPVPVSAQEVLTSMLVDNDEYEFLKRAKSLGLRSPTYTSWVSVQVHDLCSIQLNGDLLNVPLPAQFHKRTMQLSSDKLAALKEFCERKMALSDHWTNTRMLFRYLNETCKSPQQVRYVMPSVVGLLSYDRRTRPLATKLTPIPTLRTKPVVHASMRPIIEASNRLISQAKLIIDSKAPTSPEYQNLSVNIQGMITCPWHDEMTASRVQV